MLLLHIHSMCQPVVFGHGQRTMTFPAEAAQLSGLSGIVALLTVPGLPPGPRQQVPELDVGVAACLLARATWVLPTGNSWDTGWNILSPSRAVFPFRWTSF